MHSSFSTSNAMIKKVSKRGSNEVKVTFVLPDDHTLGDDVSVVGDFNDWTAGENAFVRRSNQTYSTNVMLEEGGRYAFRYYSEESGWANEEEADDFETNEYGDTNCIVETCSRDPQVGSARARLSRMQFGCDVQGERHQKAGAQNAARHSVQPSVASAFVVGAVRQRYRSEAAGA